MKLSFTLISILFCSTGLFAQSALNCDLGLSYHKVETFLGAKSFVTVNYESADRIVARTENHVVTYYFHQEVLYKTDLVVSFANEKDAAETVRSFRNYYDLARAEILDLDTDKDHPRFAALHGREIHEVAQVNLDRRTTQVRQSKMDLDRCPGNDLKELSNDELLFSMLYK
ncbi:MAG: hypothetical protein AAGN35_21890 [Bacteroidota bacterium]